MPNNYLSVLYKHIIQVENENVGLKVCVCVGGGGGGGAQTYHCPQSKKWEGRGTCPLPPPPRFLRQCICMNVCRPMYIRTYMCMYMYLSTHITLNTGFVNRCIMRLKIWFKCIHDALIV